MNFRRLDPLSKGEPRKNSRGNPVIFENEENSSQQVRRKEWMNVKELAEYLSTTPGGIYNQVYRGILSPGRNGRRLLFRKSEIDRLVDGSR